MKQPEISIKDNAGKSSVLTPQSEANRDYQQQILTYITHIGASLRLHMNTDTLLKNVSEAVCNALRFRHCALYLFDGDGYYRVRAVAGGVSAELEEYLRQHPMPVEVVQQLLCGEHRISNSYFIPAEASLWQDEVIASYFVVVDEDGNGSPVQPSSSLEHAPNTWCVEDLLMVPLWGADHSLLGILTPDAPEDGLRPTAETLTFLELFANQAAVVIEGSRLYEEEQRSSEERAALIEIGRALSAPEAVQDLQTVYQTIYEQVRRVMPADAFFVSHYNRDPEGLIMDFFIDEGICYPPVKYSEFRPQTRNFLYHDNAGLIFSSAEEYDAFVSNEAETLVGGDEEDVFGNGRPSQSLLFIPIRYGDEPIGMLSAQSYRPHAYTHRHREMLREIGVQAGIAIMNARLNAELRDALKQAQESERLKNHFLMTASHELRTPLTAIQGYLELLSSFSHVLDDASKERFVTNARRACDELVLLLGNVMDTSRIDQDRVTLSLGEVQVTQAVQVILEIMEPTIAREQRAIDVQIDEHLSVWVDDLRLRQVLLNLVGNALKYSEAGTALAISAESVRVEALSERLQTKNQSVLPHAGNRFVIIAIRDWGPGISTGDQERLFTKFMRLERAINSAQHGAGLGLYLCRQLIEAMGGNIWVDSASRAGEGSTFFIALPQYDASVKSLEESWIHNG